jgi:hypothetical protein
MVGEDVKDAPIILFGGPLFESEIGGNGNSQLQERTFLFNTFN